MFEQLTQLKYTIITICKKFNLAPSSDPMSHMKYVNDMKYFAALCGALLSMMWQNDLLLCFGQYSCEEASCFGEAISYNVTSNYIECHGLSKLWASNYNWNSISSIYWLYKIIFLLQIRCNCIRFFWLTSLLLWIIFMCKRRYDISKWGMYLLSAGSNILSLGTPCVFCRGDRSCSESRISSENRVDFYGNLAGLNSITYSNGSGSTTTVRIGYYSK